MRSDFTSEIGSSSKCTLKRSLTPASDAGCGRGWPVVSNDAACWTDQRISAHLAARRGVGIEQRTGKSGLETLRTIRADIARVDEKVDSLRADVASDFVLVNARIVDLRKETSEQIVGLRRAVVEYHSAVLGHGILISELEARVRRMERHLGLSETEAE